MRKDIEIPKVENVYIIAVKEWDEEFSGQQWNIYVVNDRKDEISMVLVLSRGNSEDIKTSTLRHDMGDLASKTFKKIELITSEVLGFTNEYLVTFFAENKLFERKFVFEPNSISEEKMIEIPLIKNDGIVAI